MTIVEFIEARLVEDERAASAAAGQRWSWDRIDETFHVHGNAWDIATIHTGPVGDPDQVDVYAQQRDNAIHIARHDPGRVLREVSAKRAILAEHTNDEGQCSRCLDSDGVQWAAAGAVAYTRMWPCPTVLALAEVYATHPDYQRTWWS